MRFRDLRLLTNSIGWELIHGKFSTRYVVESLDMVKIILNVFCIWFIYCSIVKQKVENMYKMIDSLST